MQFYLNGNKPLYVQVAEWIEHNIVSGVFEKNEKIPSVFDISAQYKINPSAVTKGINLLIDKGLLNENMVVVDNTLRTINND